MTRRSIIITLTVVTMPGSRSLGRLPDQRRPLHNYVRLNSTAAELHQQ